METMTVIIDVAIAFTIISIIAETEATTIITRTALIALLFGHKVITIVVVAITYCYHFLIIIKKLSWQNSYSIRSQLYLITVLRYTHQFSQAICYRFSISRSDIYHSSPHELYHHHLCFLLLLFYFHLVFAYRAMFLNN